MFHRGAAAYHVVGRMGASVLELIVKPSSDCSGIELGLFIAFVRAGGEVTIQGLTDRIRSSAALVFARVAGSVVGVAALKRPQASYRRRISSESGTPLHAPQFPYELGWVYVLPESRGKGFSFHLARIAVAESKGDGVFATSRTDNIAMHRSLAKLGFIGTGIPFASGRSKHSMQVFVRAAQPGVPADLVQNRGQVAVFQTPALARLWQTTKPTSASCSACVPIQNHWIPVSTSRSGTHPGASTTLATTASRRRRA